MNTEVDKVQNWLLANKLSVHYVDKSKYMLINSNISNSVDTNFELKMGGHLLERTKAIVILAYWLMKNFHGKTISVKCAGNSPK